MSRSSKVTRRSALAISLISSLFFTSFSFASNEKLIAAYYSDRYHVASCKIAQKIHPDDRVYYDTAEAAVAAGLIPCKKCDPPVPANYKKTVQSFASKKTADSDPDIS